MKLSLVLLITATLTLAACGGTSQNPLTKYPQSQTLTPKDPTIPVQGPNIQWVEKPVPDIREVTKYVTKEVEVKVPVVKRVPLGEVRFFSVTAPNQIQFVVGKPTTVSIVITGLKGQLKYDVAIESPTHKQMKLENIKVDGNVTTADLTFTAAASDIPAGETLALGSVTYKMTVLEVKDSDAELEQMYRQIVQSESVQKLNQSYVIALPGTRVSETPKLSPDAQVEGAPQ